MKVTLKSFSKPQVERLADISSDLGMVFTASVVLPTLTSEFSWPNFISGSIFATGFIITSIKLSKQHD